MILAVIAMIASLDTRSAYQFVDVSQIQVTGDAYASSGENVKGEHFARFQESVAEAKWIMEKCGANIYDDLRTWSPTPAHEITSYGMNAAVAAYNSIVESNVNNSVSWFYGDNFGTSALLFSKTYIGYEADETVEQIEDAAWTEFCRSQWPQKVDYSQYQYSAISKFSTITNGSQISASYVDGLMRPPLQHKFSVVGSNLGWRIRDDSYASTTSSSAGERWVTEGAPFYYNSDFGASKVGSGRISSTPFREDVFGNHYYEFWRILKGEFCDSGYTVTTTRIGTPVLKIQRSDTGEEIVGRTGIRFNDSGSRIVAFLLCWKCGWGGEVQSSINARVYAKELRFRSTTALNTIIDEVWQDTPQPDGENHSGFVCLLFVRHGAIWWYTNANSI